MSHFIAPRARAVICGLRVFFLAACSRPATAAASLGWNPARTWVFTVSLLEFKETAIFEFFPTQNRRDDQLIAFFRRQGVPRQQIFYWKDRQAKLRALQASFRAML